MKKLDEIETKVLEETLRNLDAEEQILDINSEKPSVIHKEHKQLSFIIDGRGYAQVGDEVFEVERGCLVLFPENTKHSFLCVEGNMKLLHLHTPRIYGDEDWYMLEKISDKWSKFLC